jgi:hypothetical protein
MGPWACAIELLFRGLPLPVETLGFFSTLLVPFQNVISERRILHNKSGKSGESGEIEKWRNF